MRRKRGLFKLQAAFDVFQGKNLRERMESALRFVQAHVSGELVVLRMRIYHICQIAW